MTQISSLNLEILPPSQRRLWAKLDQIPAQFTLYGGTAIALQLGHRQSIDFDFFSSLPLDESQPLLGIKLLEGATVTQRVPNTLSVTINQDDPVKVSFFAVPKLPILQAPHIAQDNGLKIASLLDLAGTKVSVVQLRAEAKDYLDIDAILTSGHVSLDLALAAGQALYGTSFNPQSALKALSYFGEDGLRDLHEDLRIRLARSVRGVNLDRLPVLPLPYYNQQQ